MASCSAAADAVALVVREHRAMAELFERFDLYDDTSAVRVKRQLFREISRALSVHAAAEEQVIYPVVRAEMPGGARLADDALADHRQVKDTLATLGAMDDSDPGFVVGVKALAASVQRHVADEERDLLPLLQRHLSAKRLLDLGKAFAWAETVAPTRPHPGAPDRPPLNVVVGLASSVIDRVKDLVDVAAERGRHVVDEFEKKDGPTRS